MSSTGNVQHAGRERVTRGDTTLLTGGRIHSPAAPDATAMAVTDGTVVWVGQDGPGRALHPDADAVELDGAFVAPAFVDAHVHATATGLHLSGVDLSAARSGAELLETLRQASAGLRGGETLWAHGWDESTWDAERIPSRSEVDRAVGDVAVYASRIDAHSALVSSALAAKDAQAAATEAPVTGDAHHRLRRIARESITPSQRAAAQRRFLDAAAAAGIASVHECAGPDISGWEDLDALLALDHGVEVVPYWGELASDAVLAKAAKLRGLAGDLFVDGAIGSHTAAVHEPYADTGGIGTRYLTSEQIADHVMACTEAGLQAGFHVIGDAALSEVIAGFQAADGVIGRRAIVGGRHRLEHVEMIDDDQAKRLADFNIAASVQPAFDALWGGQDGLYAQRLGVQRASRMNPFSMMAATGVVLAGGSDAPVTAIDPWASVRAMVGHRTAGSGVSARAAFNAHTKGGYRAAGVNDGLTGTLVPGAPAHYAVWDAGNLEVSAPDARVQRWSTDPRSRVPALPSLDGELPKCLRTVRAGVTIFAA